MSALFNPLMALVLGMAVPWLVVRMLVPVLVDSDRARTVNYRGTCVSYGLGVVWFVWGLLAVIAGFIVALSTPFSSLSLLVGSGLLSIVAFGFGLIDDAYGSSDARGFRGHLGSMLKGRLTTGGLKLLGIGSSALLAGFYVANLAWWGQGPGRFWVAPIAGAGIALTANLLNLTDLRPGRALKAYTLLAFAAWCLVTFVWVPFVTSGALQSVSERGSDGVALALFLAGPMVAIAHYDLGEVGMLGDAGANAMGAVVGFLLVTSLPLVGVIIYAIAVFALNVASERVSFSKIIDVTPPLAWLDGLGRMNRASGYEDSSKDAAHDPHGRSRIESGDRQTDDEGETRLI